MKWLKTYEAAANHNRNANLRKLKSKANSKLPTIEQIEAILYKFVFDEEYNNLCDRYIIPHMPEKPDKLSKQRNINLEQDEYKGFIHLRVEPQDDKIPQYGSNYAGICRLLNDYYMGSVSPVIFEEKKRIIDGEEIMAVEQQRIYPRLQLLINTKGDTCELMFSYHLSWAGLAKISIGEFKTSITKNGLNKADVLEFFEKECVAFKEEKMNLYFLKFEKDFLLGRAKLKDFITGLINYKKANILKSYPMVVDMLGLDLTEIEKGGSLGDMGFED